MYYIHYHRGTSGNFIVKNINNALNLDSFEVSFLGNCHCQNILDEYKFKFFPNGNDTVKYFLNNNIIKDQFALPVENELDYNFLLNYSKENKIITITYSTQDIFQLNYNFFTKYYLDKPFSISRSKEFSTIHNISNSPDNLTKEEYTSVLRNIISTTVKDFPSNNKLSQSIRTEKSRVFNLKFSDIMYFNKETIDSLYNFLNNPKLNKKKFLENFLTYQKKQTYLDVQILTLSDFEKVEYIINLIQKTYENYLQAVKLKKNENINYR